MIYSFDTIICYVSKFFKLQTGTTFSPAPAGVGPVKKGDILTGTIEEARNC
jgi:2-keto-4-pentenoate hydratase/2-oxohepta-3-ene-1,7-dioic acid hydratase in catechol pathway